MGHVVRDWAQSGQVAWWPQGANTAVGSASMQTTHSGTSASTGITSSCVVEGVESEGGGEGGGWRCGGGGG